MNNGQRNKRRANSKPSKKKHTKLIAGVLGAALLVGGGATYYALTKEDNGKIAVEKENVETSETALSFNKLFEQLTFDEETIYDKKAYKKYLQGFGEERITNAVAEQLDAFIKSGQPNTYIVLDQVELFELVKLEDETVQYLPVTTKLVGNVKYENLTLTIGGKEILLNNPTVEIGPILPGHYTYALKGTLDSFPVDEEIDLEVTPTLSSIEIVPTLIMLSFSSPYGNTGVSVNGSISYGKELKMPVINIPVGTSVEVYGIVEFEGKEYVSETMTVQESKMITFEFPELDALMKDINNNSAHLPEDFPSDKSEQEIFVWQQVSEMLPSFLHASQNYEVNKIAQFVDKQSSFYTTYMNALTNAKNNNELAELEWVTIDQVDAVGVNHYEVLVNEEYKQSKSTEADLNSRVVAKYILQFKNGQLVIVDKIVQ